MTQCDSPSAGWIRVTVTLSHQTRSSQPESDFKQPELEQRVCTLSSQGWLAFGVANASLVIKSWKCQDIRAMTSPWREHNQRFTDLKFQTLFAFFFWSFKCWPNLNQSLDAQSTTSQSVLSVLSQSQATISPMYSELDIGLQQKCNKPEMHLTLNTSSVTAWACLALVSLAVLEEGGKYIPPPKF